MNKKEATKVCYEAMNQGLLLIHTKTDSIKIAPPLVISKANLVTGITILCKIIHSLKVNS